MSEIDVRRSLFNWGESELPADKRQAAFEQYKLYLDLTDRLSQRRQSVGSFFVTVTTAVVAILGYAKHERAFITVSVAGLLLSVLWWRIIESYRKLNRARFEIIYAMETLLPLKPYTAEWDFVGRGANSKFYESVSSIEAYVPLLFFVLFACVLLWTVLPHFL